MKRTNTDVRTVCASRRNSIAMIKSILNVSIGRTKVTSSTKNFVEKILHSDAKNTRVPSLDGLGWHSHAVMVSARWVGGYVAIGATSSYSASIAMPKDMDVAGQ